MPNYQEIDILGMYHHLTGTDGGIKFPDGFKAMLEDSQWGITVVTSWACLMGSSRVITEGDKKGPVICGYWDDTVGGYHAVALYGFKKDASWYLDSTIWAMDPNPGMHIKRNLSYYIGTNKPKGLLGYIEYQK